MDPKRNELSTLLNLPTKRLLSVFRKERSKLHFFVEDWVWTCDCSECLRIKKLRKEVHDRLAVLQEELNKREHVPKQTHLTR
jgi:hypothetical protein